MNESQEKYSSYAESGMHEIAQYMGDELKTISIPDPKTQTHNDKLAIVLHNNFIKLFAELEVFFSYFSEGSVPSITKLGISGNNRILNIYAVINDINNLFENRKKFYNKMYEYINKNNNENIDIKKISNLLEIKELKIKPKKLETIINEFAENIKYFKAIVELSLTPEMAVEFLSLPKSTIFYQFLDKLNAKINPVNFESLMSFYNHSKNFELILGGFEWLKYFGFLKKFSNLRLVSPNTYSVTEEKCTNTYCLPEKYNELKAKTSAYLNHYKNIYASEMMLEKNQNMNNVNLDSLSLNIEQIEEIHLIDIDFGGIPMTEHKRDEVLDTVDIEFTKFNQESDFENLINQVNNLKKKIIFLINEDRCSHVIKKLDNDLELLNQFSALRKDNKRLTYDIVEKFLISFYSQEGKVVDKYNYLKLLLGIKGIFPFGPFIKNVEIFKEITEKTVDEAINRKEMEKINTYKKYAKTVDLNLDDPSSSQKEIRDSKETVTMSVNSSEEGDELDEESEALDNHYLIAFLKTLEKTEINLKNIETQINNYDLRSFFETDLCKNVVEEIKNDIKQFNDNDFIRRDGELQKDLNLILESVQIYKDNLILKTLNGEINSEVKKYVNYYVDKCKSISLVYSNLFNKLKKSKLSLAEKEEFESLKNQINALNTEIYELQIRLNELQIKVKFDLPTEEKLNYLSVNIRIVDASSQIISHNDKCKEIENLLTHKCFEDLLNNVLSLKEEVVCMNNEINDLGDKNLIDLYKLLLNNVNMLEKNIVVKEVNLCVHKIQDLSKRFHQFLGEYKETTNSEQVLNGLREELAKFEADSDKLFKAVNFTNTSSNNYEDVKKSISGIKKILDEQLSKEKLDSLEKDIKKDILKKKRTEALSEVLSNLEKTISPFMHDKLRNEYVEKVKKTIDSYINSETDSEQELEQLIKSGLNKYNNLRLRSCLYQLHADLLDIDDDKSSDITLDSLDENSPTDAKIKTIDDELRLIFGENEADLAIFRIYLNEFIKATDKDAAYNALKNKFIARLHSYDFTMSEKDINWSERSYTSVILAILTLGIALGISYAYTKLTTGRAYLFWEKSAQQKGLITLEGVLSDLSKENTLKPSRDC